MPSPNINRCMLTGNLTKDPELKETTSGTKVCELRLAVNTPVKRDGNWEMKPNYFQISAWAGLGENCAKYLTKGSPIAIDGRLEWQKWESKEGETNSRVVIIADTVQFLSSGKRSEGNKDPKASVGAAEDDIPF